jgi:hypothetical protein
MTERHCLKSLEQASLTWHYKGHDDDDKNGNYDDGYYYCDDNDDDDVTMTMKQIR